MSVPRALKWRTILAATGTFCAAACGAEIETVRQKLWIWGHPAGVYNASYLRPLNLRSTIEPVDAARRVGLGNMIFVRDAGTPAPPYDAYYEPFRALDRVYWSLVAAGGVTSQGERDAALALAEKHDNLVGFILDDFFPEPARGNAADPLPIARLWLADNQPGFPVTYTLVMPRPIRTDAIELEQSDWDTGDYRAKDVAIDLSPDGDAWREAARGTLANAPRAVLRLPLPATPCAALRVRFLNTHDTDKALSVGLAGLRLLADGVPLDTSEWKAAASSTYPSFEPFAPAVGPDWPGPPFRTSLTPAQLRTLRETRVRGRRLPIMCVIYTRQVKPQAKPYLAEVDQVCLWTWQPEDLDHLEANLSALERLVPGKPIYLGCYMFDFTTSRPLPVERMRLQVEQGHRWLLANRIQGMIFLATANCDVGLEAVDWTREWIRTHGDQELKPARP